ncbi:MAG: hypothetical protein IH876_02535 [Gemmatimonadetes bacterium]|nr:hypothetical protein [Gemmatimonadota bacterium]MCH7714983.1 hypothetical protein [Gemmatimonadota bacterium]
MPSIRTLTFPLVALALPSMLAGQIGPDITGTWRAETPEGPQEIIVRPDSSASFGDDIVRWRIEADSIHLAIGDEWMVYKFEVRRDKLTLSGGDLEDPIELKRVGPATPRPQGVEVPPAPPADRRAMPLVN